MKTKTKKQPANAVQLIQVLYRDASNYKDFLTVKNLSRKPVKAGDEVTMEELGYTQDEFWEEYLSHAYDPDLDHNILEVIEPLVGLTTEQAFKELLKDKLIRVNPHTKKSWAQRFDAGKLSIEKMREALLNAGYRPIQETVWVK